jgi:hypothetical protein
VKYMLLIYSNPVLRAMSEEERNRIIGEVTTLVEELTESGEWIGGEALADPENARTVRVRGGIPAVTDGPFPEAKEHLAGYCLLECDSLDRATEIAARWPDARYNGVELRPIIDPAGMET